MRIFVSVCDHSSELYADFIIKRLLETTEAEIFLIGGEKLRELSENNNRVHFWINSVKYSSIGFFENLDILPLMYIDYLKLKKFLSLNDIDLAILFDAPAVNVKLIKFLKKKGSKIIYVIPPKSWSLVRTKVHNFVENFCDYIIVPFKFNLNVYQGKNVLYFGHPISTITPKIDIQRDKSYLDFLGIFPGSRKIEIEFVSKDIFALLKEFSQKFKKIFVSSTPITIDYLKNYLLNSSIEIIHSYEEIIKRVGLALAVSGTITLQNALFSLPTICFYKVFKISEFIFKKVMKMNVDKIALPNILWKYEFKMGDDDIIPELIQDDLNKKNILIFIDLIIQNYDEFLKKLILFRNTFFEFYGKDSLTSIAEFIGEFIKKGIIKY